MKNYIYVYILQSATDPSRHYTGMTDNLAERLRKHNRGDCIHAAKYCPWVIRTATAFRDRKKAAEYEAYLKSHSGRVFASRHF